MQRTVRLFERAGATAIQLEDQTFPKRCGHLRDKSLIAAAEMAGKIKAAVDARASDETLIIARTDAVAVEGFEAAVDRAPALRGGRRRHALRRGAALARAAGRVAASLGASGRSLANMVEGGDTPLASADSLASSASAS